MPSIFDKFLDKNNANNANNDKNNAKDSSTSPQNPQGQIDDLTNDRFELAPIKNHNVKNEKIELKPDATTQNSQTKIISHTNERHTLSTAREKKIILFDLDGTLLDSLRGIYSSFCRACEEEEGKEAHIPSIEEIRTMIGLPLSEMFLRLGFSQEELESRITRYKNHYRRVCIEQSSIYPKVREALVLAREFAYLGVVTTKTGLYSKQILENFELLKYFSVVIGIEDVSEPKPDAEPILRALSFLPITPKQNVYMIGDTSLDIQSAKNAGVNAIWVRYGYGQGLEGEADKSFDNIYEAITDIKEV